MALTNISSSYKDFEGVISTESRQFSSENLGWKEAIKPAQANKKLRTGRPVSESYGKLYVSVLSLIALDNCSLVEVDVPLS